MQEREAAAAQNATQVLERPAAGKIETAAPDPPVEVQQEVQAMLQQGLLPDVISSDIHQLSIQGPLFDLPTTLSKFLNLGMSLRDVIERATVRPAMAMRKPDLGTLRPGSRADVAVFRVEEGDYAFYDVAMTRRNGTKRLVNTLTMVAGEPLERTPERPVHVWATLPEHQRPILQR